jgi:hypothetical protein
MANGAIERIWGRYQGCGQHDGADAYEGRLRCAVRSNESEDIRVYSAVTCSAYTS